MQTVLDVACGTGVDSILLVEEGFDVTSVDASDRMLKYALKLRWLRRKEPAFDKWVIEEANWLHLKKADIVFPEGGFDCVICIGNSFPHLLDFDGDNGAHFQAIKNFRDCLKPGGILVIDHRNFDHIIAGGKAPVKNIYYDSEAPVDIKTSVLEANGKNYLVTFDFAIQENEDYEENGNCGLSLQNGKMHAPSQNKFRLLCYPHMLNNFIGLLERVFGEDAKHTVLGDFELLDPSKTPAYYIHVIQKQ